MVPTPLLTAHDRQLQGPQLSCQEALNPRAPPDGKARPCQQLSSLPGSLSHLQANLTKSQNEFKIVLKELEDSLLARLSAASGNFLGDTALVENLETTKHTASEIEEKVRSHLGGPPPRTPSHSTQWAWLVG